MRIIQLPSGLGKTTALVDFMLERQNHDVIYVAPTQRQAAAAFQMYQDRKSGLRQTLDSSDASRFISANRFRERLSWGRPGVRVVVDEMDVVIETLLGAEVELAAWSPADQKRRGDGSWRGIIVAPTTHRKD